MSSELMRLPDPKEYGLYATGPLTYSSYASTTGRGKIATARALFSSERDSERNLEEPFLVQNVVFSSIQRVKDSDGEIETWTRICMVAPDGTRYVTASDTVRRQLLQLAQPGMFGPWPWDPPAVCRLVKQKAKGPGHYYSIEVEGFGVLGEDTENGAADH